MICCWKVDCTLNFDFNAHLDVQSAHHAVFGQRAQNAEHLCISEKLHQQWALSGDYQAHFSYDWTTILLCKLTSHEHMRAHKAAAVTHVCNTWTSHLMLSGARCDMT